MTINEFLRSIASDIKITNKKITASEFYYLLKFVGIKKDSSKVNDLDAFYTDFLDNLNNSLVKFEKRELKNSNYIGFYVDKKADYKEAIKVYFPVKYEYLINGLKTTFLYLIRNNIESTVKFYKFATDEGIIIRFYHKEDVLPFIKYCQNSFALKDFIVKVNPFIATIFGLGIVSDNNIISSYNSTLSIMLEEYFTFMIDKDSLNKVSDITFLDYLIKRKDIENDDLVKFNLKAIIKNIECILNNENPLI